GASGRPVLYDTLEPAAAAMLGTRERVVADSVPVTGGEPCVHAAIHRVALATRADGEDAFLRLSRAHLPAAVAVVHVGANVHFAAVFPWVLFGVAVLVAIITDDAAD